MTFHAVCNTALSEWKHPAKFLIWKCTMYKVIVSQKKELTLNQASFLKRITSRFMLTSTWNISILPAHLLRADMGKLGLYPKSPPIPSFTIPYISPLIQFTWRSEWERVSEFGHWVHRKYCRFCIVCLLFNNHLKRAAPVVRLKDLSWTLSRKLCINPNSQFTINLYLCCITLYYAMDEHF